jgi:uncharacterized protein with ParB-like and HNH nuclease domain
MTEGFQPARTIASVLTDIEHQQLVLPAIQREFEWKEPKICSLFDSLMRGYPIGGFLFWKVSVKTVQTHAFYGFIRDYDQRPPNDVCPRLGEIAPSDSRFAVLDGQQRLTSLNIGLRGSHTVKLPNKWWDNPDAFPKRYLYLDLGADGPDPEESGSEDETGETEEFLFRFRTSAQALAEMESGQHRWMRVSDVLGITQTAEVLSYAAETGIGNDPSAVNMLGRLHDVVHVQGTISRFVESDQSIDRVMNIFIRVNAQGEPLSFADLLLSQATAAWATDEVGAPVDAREEIRSFNQHLNRADRLFDFGRDQIMKACLVLTDAGSVRFQIENYGRNQMLQIRDTWPDIKRCLDLAAGLLEKFGLTAVNLNARSVIHPLAYYIKHRNLDASYLTAKGHEEDRERVRKWLLRSLLRQGIWGSGLDTLLTRLRKAIKDHGAEEFPTAQIEQTMAEVGKSLAFDEDAVRGLLKLRYGDKNCFPLLSLIYPSGDASRRHVDHIYPRTVFTRAKLQKLGFATDDIPRMIWEAQEVPNLQLLTPAENESKSGRPPGTWLSAAFPDSVDRAAIGALHHLGEVGDDLAGFDNFFQERRNKLATVIRDRLGVVPNVETANVPGGETDSTMTMPASSGHPES